MNKRRLRRERRWRMAPRGWERPIPVVPMAFVDDMLRVIATPNPYRRLFTEGSAMGSATVAWW